MGATQFTTMNPPRIDPTTALPDPTVFEYEGQTYRFFGAGHTVGTYAMGTESGHSVLDSDQRSWDHPNLFMVGSGVFPTVATGNPTLTIAALTLRAAATLVADLQ
jgi:choline dehydrogenase-like flavoprotein